MCVGGEDGRHPSQLHRVQNPSLGRVDRGEEAGQPRGEGESEHLRGAVVRREDEVQSGWARDGETLHGQEKELQEAMR